MTSEPLSEELKNKLRNLAKCQADFISSQANLRKVRKELLDSKLLKCSPHSVSYLYVDDTMFQIERPSDNSEVNIHMIPVRI